MTRLLFGGVACSKLTGKTRTIGSISTIYMWATGLAHIVKHARHAVRGGVMRPGRRHQGRLVDVLIVEFGVDRRVVRRRVSRPRGRRQGGRAIGPPSGSARPRGSARRGAAPDSIRPPARARPDINL